MENYFESQLKCISKRSLLSFSIFYETEFSQRDFCTEFAVNGSKRIPLKHTWAEDGQTWCNGRSRRALRANGQRRKYMSVINVNYSILKCAINFHSRRFSGTVFASARAVLTASHCSEPIQWQWFHMKSAATWTMSEMVLTNLYSIFAITINFPWLWKERTEFHCSIFLQTVTRFFQCGARILWHQPVSISTTFSQ